MVIHPEASWVFEAFSRGTLTGQEGTRQCLARAKEAALDELTMERLVVPLAKSLAAE